MQMIDPTIEKMKELRNITGGGLYECKQALLHTNTMEEAIEYVREHRRIILHGEK